MARLVLAILFVAIAIGAIAYLIRATAQVFEKSGAADAVSAGSSMQKIAFMLLFFLMIYVTLSGAS